MSNIWIIREARSGSTWFTHHLLNTLGYEHCFIDKPTYLSPPIDPNFGFNITAVNDLIDKAHEKTLFSTHMFPIVKLLDPNKKPILIRCARKNYAEQFLSYWLARSTNFEFTNIIAGDTSTNELFDKTSTNQIIVSKREVVNYMRLKKRNEELWNEYAPKFDSYTVYYEDLCETGVDIPPINLYNCRISNDGFTQKLPEYKTKVFFNHDMIHNWIEEYR